jgi:hypothetical protein
MTPAAGILEVFISHFKRAIRQEMDAMRERKGTFEIFLTNGERMESSETPGGDQYIYRLSSNDEKLVAGIECTLRTMKGEYLVRVERCDDLMITVYSGRAVEIGTGEASLVIYPWFLYEKLLTVLGEIDSRRFPVDRALTLFGKLPAVFRRVELLCAHSVLNESQRAAVQLCSDSDLAFVWGPPGTGKTTTLARIVAELLAQKMRILLLATTNAALDQALEKVAHDPQGKEWIDAGRIVRIGQTEDPTFGAGLNVVLTRLNIVHQKKLSRMLKRRPAAEAALSACRKAIDKLSVAEAPFQAGLFGNPSPPRLPPDLAAVFTTQRTSRHSPHSDIRLKKAIVRTLIHEVVVDVDADHGELILIIHWKGGVHTELRLPRRRRGQNGAQTSRDIVEAVRILARVSSDDWIASALNRSGLHTGRGNYWTRERVVSLRTYYEIPCYEADRSESEGWMNLGQAAKQIGISDRTLRLAIQRGEIKADHPVSGGPWVLNRSDLQTEAALRLLERVRRSRRNPTVPTSKQDNFGFSNT